MKRILHYLPLHFLVFLVFGIGTQYAFPFWEFGFLKLLLLVGASIVLLLFITQKFLRTLVAFITFFWVGVFSVLVNEDRQSDRYYTRFLKEDSTSILKVQKVLKSNDYYDKYIVKVIQIDNNSTKGNVLLNIKKDSVKLGLKVEERIFLKPIFEEVASTLNPHQFDYKKYLSKQGIFQQVFLNQDQFSSLGKRELTLLGMSSQIRNTIEESLKKNNFKGDELGVMKALLLGQRQDISKGLKEDYANAGVVHILAVSGLHVGVLFFMLSFIFKPLERLKNGVIVKVFFIILLLWSFAFISGLSASVVRAVTMFSFISIGLAFGQQKVIEFSIISSMFLLLLIHPTFLFDVGFQLSYLAVFGIVWLQPKLYRCWKPKNKVFAYFWQLFTVSIAAQIAVFPLSLFYFHQFPALFMFSNLVILPFLKIILIGGILVMLTSLIGVLPEFIALIYNTIIATMNGFVSWISRQESFLFTDISLSAKKMIFLYVFLIFGIQFSWKTSYKRGVCLLVSVVFLQSVWIFEKHQSELKQSFIVFHKNRNSLIGVRNGASLKVFHTMDSMDIGKNKSINSYAIGENCEVKWSHKKISFSNTFPYNVLVVDRLGIYKVKGLENPKVLLQYSAKVNLERLIQTLNPSRIIADGTNYKNVVWRWSNTCKKMNIPFHYTGQKGAVVLEN